MNGGEHYIPTVGFVDGYCKTTNTVYEFQGCFWHGCPKCYTADRINPVLQRDMIELQQTTGTKNKKIKDLGYNLVKVYECGLQKNSAFKKWCKTNTVNIVTPLDPRDAFFGGRTNVTKLTYDFKPGEKGRYVDFVSLYPTVNFFKKYRIGHPVKIYNPKSYDSKWFGFVQCKIEAPRGLHHPVLPVRLCCGKSDKFFFYIVSDVCNNAAARKMQPYQRRTSIIGYVVHE